jgi:SnoaL-like protein
MTKRKDDTGLDFGALRLGIERCDPDLLLGLYAEDAHLSVVSGGVSQASPFELRGKSEIAKHLRAVFGQGASHRVEREEVGGENGVKFREACEYPDGSRVVVETTLEVKDGKIVRQVDMVAKDIQTGREKEIIQRPLTGEIKPRVDELPSDDLPWCSGQ